MSLRAPENKFMIDKRRMRLVGYLPGRARLSLCAPRISPVYIRFLWCRCRYLVDAIDVERRGIDLSTGEAVPEAISGPTRNPAVLRTPEESTFRQVRIAEIGSLRWPPRRPVISSSKPAHDRRARPAGSLRIFHADGSCAQRVQMDSPEHVTIRVRTK